jgi:hypothetical protein
MSERLTLTEPQIKPEVVTSTYVIVTIILDIQNRLFLVRLKDNNNNIREFSYGGRAPSVLEADRQKAILLIKQLNTANLTIKSLQRRIFEQLIADGKITGSIDSIE